MPRRRPAREELARDGDLVVVRDRHRPGGRLLLQGDMEASYVDLAEPTRLEFDYLRRMRDLVEAIGARDVIHIGGAGCALARALAAQPGAAAGPGPPFRQEVAEADDAVLELARAHLGLDRRIPGLKVRHADGRELVARRPEASADAILVDAFVGARVPRHLVTVEALRDAARVLRPGGAVAVNVVDVPPLGDVRAIAAGLLEVFGVVAALGPGAVVRGRRGGNVVLMAARSMLPTARLRARAVADPEPSELVGPRALAALCAGSAPWRDADA